MSVKATHVDYDRFAPKWKRCRDAVCGQDAMRAAGIAYISRLKDETEADYAARLSRSNFFNATWRTIAGLKGMAFRVEPAVTLPAGITTLAADVTLSGVSLAALASNIVEEVLEVGRFGVLVDHPRPAATVTPITRFLAETMGLRPTMQVYPAETIRNWRFAKIGNAWRLVMVVLGEQAQIVEDEFEPKTEDRYRVLDLDEAGQYRQRVFKVEEGKDILLDGPLYPVMKGKPLTEIPFYLFGATGLGDAIDEPPLIDLVDANVAHYQVNSDRRHGLHFTGLPTAVVSGYQAEKTEKLYIGSQTAWIFPDPQAKASYLEFTGQGLGALKDMATELKQEMALLGARMLADESRIGSETLGGTQIKHMGENSVLGEIVGHVSAGMEKALASFALWAGASGEIVFQINKRFLPVPMGPQELTALVGAWQSGAISEAELFAKLQEGEIIDPAKPLEEHQAEVEVQGPAAPTPVAANAA